MVTCIVSDTALHPPFPVVVRIRLTDPEAVSAALGIYVALSAVPFGEKVPVPELVHCPPEATNTDPFNDTFALFPQTDWSMPALDDGGGVIVMTVVSLTALQVPLPDEVRISVTLPETLSAAEGI